MVEISCSRVFFQVEIREFNEREKCKESIIIRGLSGRDISDIQNDVDEMCNAHNIQKVTPQCLLSKTSGLFRPKMNHRELLLR